MSVFVQLVEKSGRWHFLVNRQCIGRRWRARGIGIGSAGIGGRSGRAVVTGDVNEPSRYLGHPKETLPVSRREIIIAAQRRIKFFDHAGADKQLPFAIQARQHRRAVAAVNRGSE
jgi:hypothetical protein